MPRNKINTLVINLAEEKEVIVKVIIILILTHHPSTVSLAIM